MCGVTISNRDQCAPLTYAAAFKNCRISVCQSVEYLSDLDGGALERSHCTQQEWWVPSGWARPLSLDEAGDAAQSICPSPAQGQIALKNYLIDEKRVSSWAVRGKVKT